MKKIIQLLIVVVLFSVALVPPAQAATLPPPNTLPWATVDGSIKGIECYPNPAIEYINVDLRATTVKNARFEVFSIIGNKVSVSVLHAGVGVYKMNLRGLADGYYMIMVKDVDNNQSQTIKFQKM